MDLFTLLANQGLGVNPDIRNTPGSRFKNDPNEPVDDQIHHIDEVLGKSNVPRGRADKQPELDGEPFFQEQALLPSNNEKNPANLLEKQRQKSLLEGPICADEKSLSSEIGNIDSSNLSKNDGKDSVNKDPLDNEKKNKIELGSSDPSAMSHSEQSNAIDRPSEKSPSIKQLKKKILGNEGDILPDSISLTNKADSFEKNEPVAESENPLDEELVIPSEQSAPAKELISNQEAPHSISDSVVQRQVNDQLRKPLIAEKEGMLPHTIEFEPPHDASKNKDRSDKSNSLPSGEGLEGEISVSESGEHKLDELGKPQALDQKLSNKILGQIDQPFEFFSPVEHQEDESISDSSVVELPPSSPNNKSLPSAKKLDSFEKNVSAAEAKNNLCEEPVIPSEQASSSQELISDQSIASSISDSVVQRQENSQLHVPLGGEDIGSDIVNDGLVSQKNTEKGTQAAEVPLDVLKRDELSNNSKSNPVENFQQKDLLQNGSSDHSKKIEAIVQKSAEKEANIRRNNQDHKEVGVFPDSLGGQVHPEITKLSKVASPSKEVITSERVGAHSNKDSTVPKKSDHDLEKEGVKPDTMVFEPPRDVFESIDRSDQSNSLSSDSHGNKIPVRETSNQRQKNASEPDVLEGNLVPRKETIRSATKQIAQNEVDYDSPNFRIAEQKEIQELNRENSLSMNIVPPKEATKHELIEPEVLDNNFSPSRAPKKPIAEITTPEGITLASADTAIKNVGEAEKTYEKENRSAKPVAKKNSLALESEEIGIKPVKNEQSTSIEKSSIQDQSSGTEVSRNSVVSSESSKDPEIRPIQKEGRTSAHQEFQSQLVEGKSQFIESEPTTELNTLKGTGVRASHPSSESIPLHHQREDRPLVNLHSQDEKGAITQREKVSSAPSNSLVRKKEQEHYKGQPQSSSLKSNSHFSEKNHSHERLITEKPAGEIRSIRSRSKAPNLSKKTKSEPNTPNSQDTGPQGLVAQKKEAAQLEGDTAHKVSEVEIQKSRARKASPSHSSETVKAPGQKKKMQQNSLPESKPRNSNHQSLLAGLDSQESVSVKNNTVKKENEKRLSKKRTNTEPAPVKSLQVVQDIKHEERNPQPSPIEIPKRERSAKSQQVPALAIEKKEEVSLTSSQSSEKKAPTEVGLVRKQKVINRERKIRPADVSPRNRGSAQVGKDASIPLRINIGRIQVDAPADEKPQKPQKAKKSFKRPKPSVSLSDYLRK